MLSETPDNLAELDDMEKKGMLENYDSEASLNSMEDEKAKEEAALAKLQAAKSQVMFGQDGAKKDQPKK